MKRRTKTEALNPSTVISFFISHLTAWKNGILFHFTIYLLRHYLILLDLALFIDVPSSCRACRLQFVRVGRGSDQI